MWVGLVESMVSCARPNPAYQIRAETDSAAANDGGDGGSWSSSSSPAAETTSGPGGSADADSDTNGEGDTAGEDTRSDDTTNDDTTVEGSTTSTLSCAMVSSALDVYPPCPEGSCGEGTCSQGTSEPPVGFDISVCRPSCTGDCDCPSVGDAAAIPRCIGDSCELECVTNGDCPSSMACQQSRCTWAHAYAACDGSCPAEGCVFNQAKPLANLCPPMDCWDDGNLTAALCPPPLSGDATPICFEPAMFQGRGWCALSCIPGTTECPAGLICDPGGLCLHLR
ncbi:MAG: hypothetical protein AAF721_12230 [Myxococcota bacterium]